MKEDAMLVMDSEAQPKTHMLMLHVLMCIVASFVLVSIYPATITLAATEVINVTDYGANGADNKSDHTAINNALAAAKGKSTGYSMTEVYVPAGTYYLDYGVGIYSNTWLHLDEDAKIVRMKGAKEEPMLIGVHDKDDGSGWCPDNVTCTHYGYNQCRMILVSGGEWSGSQFVDTPNSERNTGLIMAFRHSSAIAITNTILGDTDGRHMISLDGVSHCSITHCTIHDHLAGQTHGASVGDMRNSEAIHTDYISPGDPWSEAYPKESLSTNNVEINHCIFENCVVCIGTHNAVTGVDANDYRIKNCTFRNIAYSCVNAANFRNIDISNNTATGLRCFMWSRGCTGENVIHDNVISCWDEDNTYNCIEVFRGMSASVYNNTIENPGTYGILGSNQNDSSEGLCNLTIKGNTIKNAGNAAVYVRDGCMAVIEGNTLTSNGRKTADRTMGIFISKTTENCRVKNNVIQGYEYGIEVTICAAPEILGTEFSDAVFRGISLYYVNGVVPVKECVIHDCTVGLQIDATTVEARANTFRDNTANIKFYNGGKMTNVEAAGGTSYGGEEQTTYESVAVYRLFNAETGEYLYSANNYERSRLVNQGWTLEGIAWYAPVTSDSPVYHVYSPYTNEHRYTRFARERDELVQEGWTDEGICWYSAETAKMPVFRLYNPTALEWGYYYTADSSERDQLVSSGAWTYVDVAWYALSVGG